MQLVNFVLLDFHTLLKRQVVLLVHRGNIKLKTVPLVFLVLRALVALLVKNKQHHVQRPQIIVYVEIVVQVNIKPYLHLLEPVVLHALNAALVKK